MLWLIFGLLTALSYALMTIVTRYVLKDERVHAVAYYPFQISFSLIFMSFFIIFFSKASFSTSLFLAGALIAPFIYLAGILWSLAAHSEEASFISPLLQMNVLFLFLIGFFFLKEPVSLKGAVGIFFIFLGGFLVVSNGFKMPRLSKGFFLVLLSVLVDSVGKTIMKLVVSENALLLTFVITFYLFLIGWFVAFFFKRKELSELIEVLSAEKKYVYAVFSRGFLSFSALASFILALQYGLLSKVGAVSNTAPLFAVLLGFLFLKEREVKKKLIASLLIVVGLLLVS